MQKKPNIHLLLDTHVFLWLMNGDNTLSMEAQQYMERIMENEGEIGLSAISLWEISMLHGRKRIILNQPCLSWIKHSLQAPGIALVALTPEIVVDSCTLPHDFHGDPADRMIVATARILDVPLMTRDESILMYIQQGLVRCVKT